MLNTLIRMKTLGLRIWHTFPKDNVYLFLAYQLHKGNRIVAISTLICEDQ